MSNLKMLGYKISKPPHPSAGAVVHFVFRCSRLTRLTPFAGGGINPFGHGLSHQHTQYHSNHTVHDLPLFFWFIKQILLLFFIVFCITLERHGAIVKQTRRPPVL